MNTKNLKCLFDFGYGTGRVTNEFIGCYVDRYAASGRDLRVAAYDVSSAGLMKAEQTLRSRGFAQDEPVNWKPDDTVGYIAGRVSRAMAGVTMTVVFVHGHEGQPPGARRQLALAANYLQMKVSSTSRLLLKHPHASSDTPASRSLSPFSLGGPPLPRSGVLVPASIVLAMVTDSAS